jgi:hypothetical protein
VVVWERELVEIGGRAFSAEFVDKGLALLDEMDGLGRAFRGG